MKGRVIWVRGSHWMKVSAQFGSLSARTEVKKTLERKGAPLLYLEMAPPGFPPLTLGARVFTD